MRVRGLAWRSVAVCAVLVWIVRAAAMQAAAADEETASAGKAPDATITFRGRTAAVGIGFVWGASTLEFQGKTYPVRGDGFVLGAIGTASIDGAGKVYGLSKVEDLNGQYTAFTSSGAFGVGSGTVVMRNGKGVRIVMDADSKGFQLGVGPRGITLAVGEAGGPPADAGARLPPTLGFGQARYGALMLRPTLNAQWVGFAEGNPGFNGQWSFGPVNEADKWFETSNEVGLNALYDAGPYGTFSGRVSGVFSLTGGGVDAAVSNGSEINNHEYTLESGYLKWQSGDLFPSLGFNALEISGGNQNYQVFDGLLFWDGGQDNGERGGNWLTPRKAFRETGIVRLNIADLVLEGVHLKYNDDPDSETRLAGGRIEYVKDDWILKYMKLGFMYFNIYDSKNASRDGMNGYYVYHEATPLPSLADLTYTTSYVLETNTKSSGLTSAVGWYVGPAYQFSAAPWKPQLFYRYASFSGGGTRGFDSLFTGLADWGSWFQGEILGEFVLSDSNLDSHQVRLKLQPNDVVTLNLIYYKFLLYNNNQDFGVTPSHVSSSSLADEVDTILDVSLANWWSMTATLAFAVPNDGFREAVNGSSTWISGMLYTNFNF
jgi:alginate export protein